MKGLKNKDIVSGGAITLFAVWIYAQTYGFKISNVSRFGSATIPRVVAVFLAFLALGVVWDGIRAGEEERTKRELRERLPEYMTYVALLLYVVFIKRIGFLIMSALYLGAQMFILSNFNKKRIPLYFAVGCVSSAVLYYSFRYVFGVVLPSGILR